MNDDQLHQLLRSVELKPEFPPSFQRNVWARIQLEESLSWKVKLQTTFETFFHWMARPVPAMATVALTIALGASLAFTEENRSKHATAQLAYIESVSPFAAAHAESH